jgi:hypothetical protein
VENSRVLLTFSVQDDRGEDIEVHCEIDVRGNGAFWRAELYKSSTARGILEGCAISVAAVRGHIQAEVLRQRIRARN